MQDTRPVLVLLALIEYSQSVQARGRLIPIARHRPEHRTILCTGLLEEAFGDSRRSSAAAGLRTFARLYTSSQDQDVAHDSEIFSS